MLRYSTKDIIARAEQLADLQNSDFISTDEKIALLNENFQILYQKIIDSNDKTWIKSVYIQDGMELPSDFYQLARVYNEDTNVDVARSNGRAKYGYEIRNNMINLNGLSGAIVMDYYPEPPTLGLKTVEDTNGYSPDIPESSYPELDLSSKGLIGINKNVIVYSNNSRYGLMKNDPESNYPLIETYGSIPISAPSFGLYFDNCEAVADYYVEAGSAIYKLGVNYTSKNNTSPVYITSPEKCLYIRDNKAFIYDKSKKLFYGIDPYNSNNVALGALPISINENTVIIYQCGSFIYELSGENPGRYYVNGETVYVNNPFALFTPQCFPDNNKLVCHSEVENGTIYILGPDGFSTRNLINSPRFLIDNAHVLVTNKYSGSNAIESISDDTLLTYPNNAYYTMLAYLLAVSFKMKQNGDTTNLVTKYASIENQFFDSISRDANETSIMNDVYNRGSFVW